ncbi:hypothetical protein [Nocardia arthritidis]|uniref:Uncharacterized protein n=1 Tax=Nocardia arthritidis TaxID=228602 RepID=A0A6G9YTQ7_9NOCA|nr:hypothetical protein [Nocardia arthritidis]QIS16481.1 hypothetical protein F5544_43380 [Nocardia arthritidis]
MVGGTAWVLRMDFPGETFTAYRSPSLVPVPEAEPGTVIFDSYPDFEEVRSRFPEHGDLWDALRRDYHATPPVAVTPDAEGAADV